MTYKDTKIRNLRIFLVCLFLTPLLISGQKIKEKDLPQKYREFLKLTHYIILPQEKEVFMQLTSDRDRDIFVKIFWKQRDPTLGTPQNEYKEEHIKRFLYANKFLGRGTPREGWITDQGEIHIILGPPISIERFEMSSDIYPAQVWYYYGDKTKGLPPHFGIVFYKKRGAGEFKLYDPASDGPASLIIKTEGLDLTNYEQLYEEIYEIAPTLAPVTLSMIPGDIPFNFQPSLENNMILANIFTSPVKDISPAYATHFLDYKGMVSTEYLTNYVESEVSIALILDPIMGINFLHFSILPESLSIDYFEPKDQYFCNFKLDVSLRIKDDIIFQYTRNLPIYFSPNDLDKFRAHGISIEDSFPVIEGKYKLIILLQNSVGKEFSLFEKEIVIPEDSGSPRIIGPFLGYTFQNYQSSVHIPFKVLDKKLAVDPKNTFSSADDVSFMIILANVTEDLWEEGRVEVLINGLREIDPTRKTYTLRLRNYPYKNILSINYSIPVKELSPDYYEIKLILMDKNSPSIDEKKTNFIISPAEHISHPIANAKAFLLSNNFLYYYMLASQYEGAKDYERAEANFAKAYGLKPDYRKGLVDYANFLLKVQKFEKSLELVEGIQKDASLKFEYYLIKGQAYRGLEQYEKAIENFLEGNKIYNSDTRLLNDLGICYYKTRKMREALEVLKVSLRLNPSQERIEKLIAEIERDLY